MLTNEDKKWITELMNNRFAEQNKHLDWQDERMEEHDLRMDEKFEKLREENMTHIDFVMEQQMDQLKPLFEVVPGAGKSYGMLEEIVKRHETNFDYLKHGHAAISKALVSDVKGEYE